MMKIAHEAPLECFKQVQKLTDYDYFLVHLFDTMPEYLKTALEAKKQGREIILDNSIFELGKAFDMGKFAEWVNILKPTYYIVPDVLEDSEGTMHNMETWIENYKDKVDSECKMIGVVQGATYKDICDCYTYMDKKANVDKIAIPFDLSYYQWVFKHASKLVSWACGRSLMLNCMLVEGIINVKKEHHLLGCGLAEEFAFYDSLNYPWISSVDTSNPVIAGLQKIRYEDNIGLTDKSSMKLYKLMLINVTDEQKECIMHNIEEFRKICLSQRYLRRF